MGFLVHKNKGKKSSLAYLVADGAVNSALLMIFGHNYLFSGISSLSFREEILPVCMAFYCLRGFSYVYDIYKSYSEPEKNYFCLLTFMVSFHTMLCGPFVHYKDTEPFIRNREISIKKLNDGLVRIFCGLGKVVLLAPLFDSITLAGLNGKSITLTGSWLGMISFFAKYYFLISGFSDMGKGMGLTNGFELPDNCRDISLSSFTGIVSGTNTTVVDFFGEISGFCKNEKSSSKTVLTAVLCGIMLSLWYEARLNFLMVGIVAGVLCGLEKLYFKGKSSAVIRSALNFLIVLFLFGGLYFDSISSYSKWIFSLFGKGVSSFSSSEINKLILNNLTLLAVSFLIVFPPAKHLIKRLTEKSEKSSAKGFIKITKTICTALVFLISVITVASGTGV